MTDSTEIVKNVLLPCKGDMTSSVRNKDFSSINGCRLKNNVTEKKKTEKKGNSCLKKGKTEEKKRRARVVDEFSLGLDID